jgi:hypothetical protein
VRQEKRFDSVDEIKGGVVKDVNIFDHSPKPKALME